MNSYDYNSVNFLNGKIWPSGKASGWTTIHIEKEMSGRTATDKSYDLHAFRIWANGKEDFRGTHRFAVPAKRDDDLSLEWEVTIQAYAARPDIGKVKAEGELDVRFKDFEVVWKKTGDSKD